MLATTERILTTTSGSMPLPPGMERLGELLYARATGQHADPGEFAALADEAVDQAVARQLAAGIDLISSGEMDRSSFITTSRLTGFDGPPVNFRPKDLADAGLADALAHVPGVAWPKANTGPVARNPGPLAAELARFLSALARHGVDRSAGFLPEPSPGVIASLGSSWYDDEPKFLADLAAAMREEYLEIARAGLTVQIDAPDLLVDWNVWHPGQNLAEGLTRMRQRVDVINEATDGIPPSQLRVHVCHGNYPGPHTYDVELPDVIDVLYGLRAGTLVVELSNPRHRWEYVTFRDHPLPAGITLAAGVIDSCSMSVEHPRTVAAALTQLAAAAGTGHLVAATDCGFGSMTGLHAHPGITDMKLKALAQGARIASDELIAPRAS